MLDASTCFDALSSRDPSFDGRFFAGVRTTGVYCRPICPSRTPRRDRCEFFARAVEAERKGYRACFRCRPELAPGAGVVDAVPRLVAGAVTRIDEGYLHGASVDDLAVSLGVTARHLRRAVATELGVSIVDLARSRRMALATQLLQDSWLPVAEVAAAAGFTSARQLNALFRAQFGRPPSALRRASGGTAAGLLVLRLDYRPPLDWEAMLEFLAGRCTAGVEQIEGGAYRRTVRLGSADRLGLGDARPGAPRTAGRRLPSRLPPPPAAPGPRLRALFDLDAHPAAVASALRHDPPARAVGAAQPRAARQRRLRRLRVGGEGGAGAAGERRAATTVAGRVAAALGDRVETPFPGLDRLPPTPRRSWRPERIAWRGSGCPEHGPERSSRWRTRSSRGPCRSREAPTPSRCATACWPCRAWGPGRRTSSRCGRWALRTPSRPAIWACCARWARSRRRTPRPAPRPGVRGEPTPRCTCGTCRSSDPFRTQS